jgi:multidrug transporter EmrE-like cation transporter
LAWSCQHNPGDFAYAIWVSSGIFLARSLADAPLPAHSW